MGLEIIYILLYIGQIIDETARLKIRQIAIKWINRQINSWKDIKQMDRLKIDRQINEQINRQIDIVCSVRLGEKRLIDTQIDINS